MSEGPISSDEPDELEQLYEQYHAVAPEPPAALDAVLPIVLLDDAEADGAADSDAGSSSSASAAHRHARSRGGDSPRVHSRGKHSPRAKRPRPLRPRDVPPLPVVDGDAPAPLPVDDVRYRPLIAVEISESEPSADEDGSDSHSASSRGSRSSGASPPQPRKRRLRPGKRRAPFCFLCWFGSNANDRSRDVDMETLETMINHNMSTVDPAFLTTQIQNFYNRRLRHRITDKRLIRPWHRRTIWQHITHHRLDPSFVAMSTARALNEMRMQLEESGLCLVEGGDDRRRLDVGNIRLYLNITKELAKAMQLVNAPAERGARPAGHGQ